MLQWDEGEKVISLGFLAALDAPRKLNEKDDLSNGARSPAESP